MWCLLRAAGSVEALNCFSRGDSVECLLCPVMQDVGALLGFSWSRSKDASGWVSLLGLLYLTGTFYKHLAKVLFCRIRPSDSEVPWQLQ